MPMKTSLSPQNPAFTYMLPAERHLALTQDDWDSAYALACREETVRYLAAPSPETPQQPAASPAKRRGRRAARAS